MQDLDTRALVGDRTRAMTRAMSALFALIGDQLPEVKAFRDRVLPGRVLDADEVRALIASPAARTFSPRWFEEWGIPFVGHRAEVLDTDPIGKRVDLWMTVRVDPPGVVKTVRYADLPEGDSNTRCVVQSGAVIPVYTPPLLESYLHRESHDEYDEYEYPHLWPGSVVDELYELSFELASAFDWPLAPYEAFDTLGLSRPRSETATWFVLTREAPPVRPIEARWELKYATRPMNTSPQRRIRLRIPPWLPEEEALQAFRLLRRERPKGLMLPKEARTLEVARFVYERERLDGPHEPPPWKALFERWNEENPGHRFTSPSNFRTTFLRGDAAVRGLNFQVPELIDADGKYVNPTTT